MKILSIHMNVRMKWREGSIKPMEQIQCEKWQVQTSRLRVNVLIVQVKMQR